MIAVEMPMLQARFSTWTPLPGDDVFGDHLPTIFGTCGPGARWDWCVEIPLPNRVGDNPSLLILGVASNGRSPSQLFPVGPGGQSVVTRREARNRTAMNHTRATMQAVMTTFEKIPT